MNDQTTQAAEYDMREMPATGLQVHPGASGFDLHNALSERLTKAHGSLTTLPANDHFACLSDTVLSSALWAVQGLVREADALADRYWEVQMQEQKTEEARGDE